MVSFSCLYSIMKKLQFFTFHRSCIGTSFGVALITIFVLKFSSKQKREFLVGRNNQTPFLNMFNIFFGGSIQQLPTRNFARTLFCIWILACTVIRSAYQGAIFDFIKKAKTIPAMNTVPELIQNDYTLYMTTLTYNMFKFSPELREKWVFFSPIWRGSVWQQDLKTSSSWY